MKAISIKLPDPLFHDLMQKAQSSAASQSEIIRSALTAYLRSDRQAPIATCAESAARWIGIAQGPEDLATNPEHLHGFGK